MKPPALQHVTGVDDVLVDQQLCAGLGGVVDLVGLAAHGHQVAVQAKTQIVGQLGVHQKPIGLFDVSGYWAPLLALLEHVDAEGFLRGNPREWLVVSDDASSMLARLQSFQAPTVRRWIRLGET